VLLDQTLMQPAESCWHPHLEREVVVCCVRKGAQHIEAGFGCLPQRLPHYVPALSVACIIPVAGVMLASAVHTLKPAICSCCLTELVPFADAAAGRTWRPVVRGQHQHIGHKVVRVEARDEERSAVRVKLQRRHNTVANRCVLVVQPLV
jgi:hypothetical protein